MTAARPTGIRRVFVRDLAIACRIGVHAREQSAAQRVRVSVELLVPEIPGERADELAAVVDYEAVVGRIRRAVALGGFRLVETLAERIAAACLEDPRVRTARVRVEKPDAIAGAAAVGVEIERALPAAGTASGG